MIKNKHGILFVIAMCFLAVTLFVPVMAGSTQHPLRSTKGGTWLEYSVRSADSPAAVKAAEGFSRWWTADNAANDFVSVRFESFVMGQRRRGGSHVFRFDRPFEPTLKDADGVKIKILSEGNETLSINGKQYNCKWQVRQIDLALDEQTVTPEYKGKSKVWFCADVPLGGMVKMENDISQRYSASDEFMKVYEIWEIKAFGYNK